MRDFSNVSISNFVLPAWGSKSKLKQICLFVIVLLETRGEFDNPYNAGSWAQPSLVFLCWNKHIPTLQLPDIVVLCSSNPEKGLFDLPLTGELPQRLALSADVSCIIASGVLKDSKSLVSLSTVGSFFFFAAVAKQPVIYSNSATALFSGWLANFWKVYWTRSLLSLKSKNKWWSSCTLKNSPCIAVRECT